MTKGDRVRFGDERLLIAVKRIVNEAPINGTGKNGRVTNADALRWVFESSPAAMELVGDVIGVRDGQQ